MLINLKVLLKFGSPMEEALLKNLGPLVWERFKSASLERFFPVDMRETKVIEFIYVL